MKPGTVLENDLKKTGGPTPMPRLEPMLFRLAHGSAWSFVGSMSTQLATLVFSIFAARLLAPRLFGELGLLQTTIGTFGVFAGMGLGLTTIRYLAALSRVDPVRAGRILHLTETSVATVSTTVAAVVYLAAPRITGSILHAPDLTTPLRLAVGVLLFTSLNAVEAGALAGLEAFRTLALNNLLFSFVMFLLAGAGVWYHGLAGAMAGLAVANAALCWLNRRAVRRLCQQRGIDTHQRLDWKDRSILCDFTLPAILSTATLTPVIWIATTLLARQSGGYVEVGLFTVAYQWRAVTVFLSNITAQPVLALLPALHQQNDLKGFRRLLGVTVLLNVATGAGVGLLIIAGADWIAAIYGRDFSAAQLPIRLLIGASILNCYTSALGNALASVGRMWSSLGLNAFWAVCLLASTAILTPDQGATGLAFSFLLSYLALAILGSLFAWRPLLNWDNAKFSSPAGE